MATDESGRDSPGDKEYRATEGLLCMMIKLRGEGGERKGFSCGRGSYNPGRAREARRRTGIDSFIHQQRAQRHLRYDVDVHGDAAANGSQRLRGRWSFSKRDALTSRGGKPKYKPSPQACATHSGGHFTSDDDRRGSRPVE